MWEVSEAMGSCRYPGLPDSFNVLFDSVDADLISDCVVGHCRCWCLSRAQPYL